MDEQANLNDGNGIVDWAYFEKSRAELGPGFIRILGYYREDGAKSVAQIEQAMREQDSVALVIPAHTLKGESRQFGASPLADIAERIEDVARSCIETHRFPDELVPDVVELRRMFNVTVELFEKARSARIPDSTARAGRSRPLGRGSSAGWSPFRTIRPSR